MNRAKLLEVLEAIKADFSRWNQATWTNIGFDCDIDDDPEEFFKEKTEEGQIINCGTTACIAGHTAFMFAPVGTRFFTSELKLPFDKEVGFRPVKNYDDFARKELELTNDEAEYLFNGVRPWEQIEAFVNADDAERHAMMVDKIGSRWLACWEENGNHTCGFPH